LRITAWLVPGGPDPITKGLGSLRPFTSTAKLGPDVTAPLT
jgi:hypothetical protein